MMEQGIPEARYWPVTASKRRRKKVEGCDI